MLNYLFQLASAGGNGGGVIESVFDTNFINSIVYSQEVDYRIRSAASEWHFQYSGTYLGLKVKPTAYSSFPQWSQIIIVIDGTVHSIETFTDESIKDIILPGGNKTVQLIESLISKPSGIIGTFLTDIILDSKKFTKINESTVSEKLVFLGDSITVGANATNPSVQGFAHLFKYDNSKQIGILGYGYGKVKDFAENQTRVDAVIAHITEMFSNVTTTKKLVIALGTNDFGLDSTTSATLSTWYGNLLDAINSSDNTIQVFCISPIIRSNDAQLLDDYRTAISGLCASRAYATYIEGKTILTLSDLVDGVHPSTAGHAKYKLALESYLL